MDGEKSSARVEMCLPVEGRSILLRRDYKNVAAIPALGERRKIYYRRSTGEWEFCSMARSWWLLWAVLAAAAGAAGLFLLLGGREVQAQLSDYTVEQPNLAGSVMCLLLAAGVLAAEAAFLWGVFLPMLRETVRPILWLVRRALGRCEPVQARFTAWVEKSDGDGGHDRYPLFSLGPGRDLLSSSQQRETFRPGDAVTLYQDPKGRLSMRPAPMDFLCLVFSCIPLVPLGAIAVCLLAAGGFLLGFGVSGIALCL